MGVGTWEVRLYIIISNLYVINIITINPFLYISIFSHLVKTEEKIMINVINISFNTIQILITI